jgi:hypothetical protein
LENESKENEEAKKKVSENFVNDKEKLIEEITWLKAELESNLF